MLLTRRGDRGPAVAEIRRALQALSLLSDGSIDAAETTARDFDADCERAVRCFQQSRGLLVDGMVGPETRTALVSARWRLGDRELALGTEPLSGDDVAALQEWLLEMGYDVGRPDAVFGARTERALTTFQHEVGIGADGVCGARTVSALHRLGRRIVGGRPLLMRENEVLRHRGRQLGGKRILIDPGHGGADRGAAVGAVTEADLTAELARRLVGRLLDEGVDARTTHDLVALPADDATRAQRANEVDADLLISLHVDAHDSPDARGLATFHFGNGSGVTSTVGERVAALVQDELLSALPFTDCRTHGRSWEMLRRTRMPAVRVELGYLTSAHDRALLVERATQDVIVEALVNAVRRVYAPIDIDETVYATAV